MNYEYYITTMNEAIYTIDDHSSALFRKNRIYSC